MRAKTINEIENFERGQDPKASMDIGGVVFQDYYDEFKEEFEKAKQIILNNANEDWAKFVKKTLMGKTITAHMKKLVKIGPDKKVMGKQVSDTFTVKVADVLTSDHAYSYDLVPSSHIVIGGEDGEVYSIDNLKQKITIH